MSSKDLSSFKKELNIEVSSLVRFMRGFSINEENCIQIAERCTLRPIVDLISRQGEFDMPTSVIAAECVDILINVSSYDTSCKKMSLMGIYEDGQNHDIFWKILEAILVSKNRIWISKCLDLLSNLSRSSHGASFISSDKHGALLSKLCQIAGRMRSSFVEAHMAMTLIANLSQDYNIAKILVENIKFWRKAYEMYILPAESERWKEVALFSIKNIAKCSPDFHKIILISNEFILTIALTSLMTEGVFSKPETVSEIPKLLTKTTVDVTDLKKFRLVSLHILYLLCTTAGGRIMLRDLNVYSIMKELALDDLSDSESEICLDIIGLLIRTEEEIGASNLASLDIPPDVIEKFRAEVNPYASPTLYQSPDPRRNPTPMPSPISEHSSAWNPSFSPESSPMKSGVQPPLQSKESSPDFNFLDEDDLAFNRELSSAMDESDSSYPQSPFTDPLYSPLKPPAQNNQQSLTKLISLLELASNSGCDGSNSNQEGASGLISNSETQINDCQHSDCSSDVSTSKPHDVNHNKEAAD